MDYKIVDGIFKNGTGETPEQYAARVSGQNNVHSPKVSDSVFKLVGGELRNVKNENVNDYKVRLMTENGINFTNFRIIDNVLRNDNFETPEEYIDRLDRISLHLKNEAKNYDEMKKREEKQKKKGRFRRALKKLPKRIAIATLSTIGAVGAYYGMVFGASAATQVDGNNAITQNDGYTPYENIPAGYYNKHPLKICISDTFNGFEQTLIKSSLEYMDSKSEGATFDISVGNIKKTDAAVKVVSFQRDCNKDVDMSILGQTSLGNKKAKEIKGTIYLNTSTLQPFGIGVTAMHEAGHLIYGLHHSDDMMSFMFHSPTRIFMSEQDVKNLNDVLPAEKIEEKKSTENMSNSTTLKNSSYEYYTISDDDEYSL